MTTRSRSRTRSARPTRAARSSGFAKVIWKRPLVVAALGVALGAAVGSFVRSATEGKELLGRSSDKLKKHFEKFKSGVSELAVESYFQAGEGPETGTDNLPAADKPHLPNGALHNSLLMADSELSPARDD